MADRRRVKKSFDELFYMFIVINANSEGENQVYS